MMDPLCQRTEEQPGPASRAVSGLEGCFSDCIQYADGSWNRLMSQVSQRDAGSIRAWPIGLIRLGASLIPGHVWRRPGTHSQGNQDAGLKGAAMYIEGLGYQTGKTGSAQWAGADCEASQIPETFASFTRFTVCITSQ